MEILKKINKDHVFLLLLFFLLIAVGSSVIDPDFGYRLKNGELIATKGFEFFSRTDPYSYTMPSYAFVEHSWLTALLIHLVYSMGGYVGLSLIWSLVAIVSLFLSLRTSKTKFYEKIPFGTYSNFLIVFIYVSTISIFAIRVQVFSWLFLTLFLYLYFSEKLWKKFKYFVPAIFLLWVNMHGSYIAGILVFFFLTCIKIFNIKFPREISLKEFRKILSSLKFSPETSDIAIFFASIVVTLINPYGLGIWRKTSKVISAGELRWEIQEWVPKPLGMDFAEGFYLTISIFLVIKKRMKISSQKLYLYFAFLFQGLMASRHFQLYLLVSMPITFDALYYLYQDVKKIKFAKKRLFLSLKFLTFLSLFLFIWKIILTADSFTLSEKGGYYPSKAINFIKQDLPEGQIFSLYGWGGYLNWKLPEKKVFISGFMPLWSRESAPEGESLYAYREYTDIIKDKINYKEVYEKYGIEMVLMPVEKEPRLIDKLSSKISNYFGEIFGKEEGDSLLERMEKDGWEEIYKDETAIIYQDPQ